MARANSAGCMKSENLQIIKVAKVIAAAIDYQDVGDALSIQRAEQVAADESCTAGYYDHCFTSSLSASGLFAPRTTN